MRKLIVKFKNEIRIVKKWHEKYHIYLPAVFFSLGFIFDILTLGDIDDTSNIIMLSLYLILSCFIISFEYLEIDQIEVESKVLNKMFEYRADIFHFFLGSLLSAFTLFYFKSSSLANSFVFMLIMASLLMLNEIELVRKLGNAISSALLMLCLVSYFIYIIPMIIGQTGLWIFLLCIFLGSVVSFLTYFLLNKRKANPEKYLKELLIPQFLVLIIFLSLYLFRIFPPIPLSLKSIDTYHLIEKIDGEYKAQKLKSGFWSDSTQFKVREGDKVYIMANIFAPGGFSGEVNIHWLFETPNGLQTSDKISMNITGGRREGFRGYTYKSNFTEGQWQVRVETKSGLEIGRYNFEIIYDESSEEREFKLLNL